ncbi:MAG: FHA domain-containing protein [Faecousia sp.]
MITQPQPQRIAYGAKLVIMEGASVTAFPLEGQSEWIIGRAETTASPGIIALRSPVVSRFHGKLCKNGSQWFYLDNPGNTNGTIVNGVLLPKSNGSPVPLYDGDVLRIDKVSSTDSVRNAVLMLFTTAAAEGTWDRYSIQGKTSVIIGRSPQCDIVQALPYLSAKHAEIQIRRDGYYLRDCGSKAGTFLNRQRITQPVKLRDKDHFRLADRSFFLVGDALIYMASARRLVQPTGGEKPVILRADIRTKRVRDNSSGTGYKELIRDIHLELRQGTLIAMLGTAGAGKTTVMNCLNGMDLVGVDGSIIYRNVNLTQNFDQMKNLIGSVPQKKVFHPTFTPEQEFYFAARKRLPGDTTDAEIQERVDRTLDMLSIQGVRRTRNNRLSGGEQTRVNVGIELVADRDFLCLDEPDQGLSPNYKHELFQILRRLAHENGKTMLSIIHDVSEIDMFDQVILLAKKDQVGRLAFSGSPADARRFFGVDIRDAYALLDKHPERYIR